MALSVIDAFRARRSFRNFAGGALEPEKEAAVARAVSVANSLPVPFGTTVEIGLHPPGLGKNIKNEVGWLIGKLPEGAAPADKTQRTIDLSFRLHYASLILTQEGIGTIWIIGTFAPAAAVAANPGFAIPAGIAYGLVPGETYLKPKPAWYGAQRKPLPELFFNADAGEPITEANAGPLLDFVQALRSGPTAMNKQPWRFVIGGGAIAVFNAIGNEASWYDIGIALANIAYLLKAKGVDARFEAVAAPPAGKVEGAYVISANLE
jgi:nitroreductase